MMKTKKRETREIFTSGASQDILVRAISDIYKIPLSQIFVNNKPKDLFIKVLSSGLSVVSIFDLDPRGYLNYKVEITMENGINEIDFTNLANKYKIVVAYFIDENTPDTRCYVVNNKSKKEMTLDIDYTDTNIICNLL